MAISSKLNSFTSPISFGKYDLLERINVGGMAEVFRAKAYGVEGFERLVAVKRILPNIAEDQEFIRMFIDEAKIAVQLNHANIAQIFDLGVEDDSYYIALEHIHGRDLRAVYDRCRNRRQLIPVSHACFVAMKLCEGLDYAHNKRDQAGRMLGLVHRDVSPQNILVSFDGEVKIIDFGIAKAVGKGPVTQAGILKGKFGYMSPEQVRGLPIDRRSDIFSCGIVLYELLTGQRLFVGESDFATLEKVRNVEIIPPRDINPSIPDELERIVLSALASTSEDRYQNAIDLHDELQAFIYTTGEFCSRKDLALWMKRLFAKEIEDETARIESFQLLPSRGQENTEPRRMNPSLDWDDEELETSIYDEPPPILETAPKVKRPTSPPVARAATIPPAAPKSTPTPEIPTPSLPPSTRSTTESSAISAIALAAQSDISDPLAIAAPAPIYREPTTPLKRQTTQSSRETKVLPWIVAALCAVAVAAGIVWFFSKSSPSETSAPDRKAIATNVAPGNSGFKLWVSPPPAKILLDGEEQDWPLEADEDGNPGGVHIEDLTAGTYELKVIAPEGYKNTTHSFEISPTNTPEINLTLKPNAVQVLFSSTPMGANVVLVSNGKQTTLGPTPTSAKISADGKHQVMFFQDGYVTVSQPIEVGGKASLTINQRLTKATGGVTGNSVRRSRGTNGNKKRTTTSNTRSSAVAVSSEANTATKTRMGLVTFSAKPVCEIRVDGKSRGKTPKKLKLSVGRHKIQLKNSSFGIEKSYTINVKPGAQLFKKDLSSLIQ